MPDRQTVTAELPARVSGHLGPEPRRFILAQFHQGRMTVVRLVQHGRRFNMCISVALPSYKSLINQ